MTTVKKISELISGLNTDKTAYICINSPLYDISNRLEVFVSNNYGIQVEDIYRILEWVNGNWKDQDDKGFYSTDSTADLMMNGNSDDKGYSLEEKFNKAILKVSLNYRGKASVTVLS